MKLGEKQTLVIVNKVDFGAYLSSDMQMSDGKVLLPIKQLPEGKGVGDELEVFIYRDSADRLIATVKTPTLVLGQVAELTVAQVGKVGAFLDWGLEKDLFLPFKQQTRRVDVGDKVLVSMYIDKSSRLCATMNVYQDLLKENPYKVEDTVSGRVYQISENFGAFVAVDNLYSALIPKKELFADVKIGDDVTCRVINKLDDGRLTLSLRKKAYLQIEDDAEKLLEILDSFEGVLPFNDRVAPEVIKYETGMSKNEFKRAVGHLLKAGMVEIGEKCIRRL